jgi:hypothetical protein
LTEQLVPFKIKRFVSGTILIQLCKRKVCIPKNYQIKCRRSGTITQIPLPPFAPFPPKKMGSTSPACSNFYTTPLPFTLGHEKKCRERKRRSVGQGFTIEKKGETVSFSCIKFYAQNNYARMQDFASNFKK